MEKMQQFTTMETMEPTTIDYSYFVNSLSSRRRPAITRELTKLAYSAPKENISLAEGMPNEITFPFEDINVTLKDGSSFNLNGVELGTALQYIPSQGFPPLVQLLKEFQVHIHNSPIWHRSELIMTNGSQDGISKSIEMCLQEGEAILVQNPLYTGAEIVMKPYKPELLPIAQDKDGLIPSVLRRTLRRRQKLCILDPTKKMPKLLYVNPTGANPTGIVMTLERRKEIYKIACQYNLLILEDDPYMFLHFLEECPPSFQSLDVEGRVLRFDSFSKVLSPGLRIGWVSGPKELIRGIELHIQSSYLHSSTLSQFLTYKLISNWGFENLLNHFNSIRLYYKARRDITLEAMQRHLTGLAEWETPEAGMFVWIKVTGVVDVYDMLLTRGLKKLITLAPGHAFMADPTQSCNFIRISYSKVAPEKIDRAMELLAELIREELDREKLDDLDNCT